MNTDNKLDKPNASALAEKLNDRPVVAPPVDIYENTDELLLVADLPGVAKDDLTIHFEKGQLTVEGRRRAENDDARAFDYRRIFAVPQGIDAQGIGAELANGVLRVHLPKSAAVKPRQIAIRAS